MKENKRWRQFTRFFSPIFCYSSKYSRIKKYVVWLDCGSQISAEHHHDVYLIERVSAIPVPRGKASVTPSGFYCPASSLPFSSLSKVPGLFQPSVHTNGPLKCSWSIPIDSPAARQILLLWQKLNVPLLLKIMAILAGPGLGWDNKGDKGAVFKEVLTFRFWPSTWEWTPP